MTTKTITITLTGDNENFGELTNEAQNAYQAHDLLERAADGQSGQTIDEIAEAAE